MRQVVQEIAGHLGVPVDPRCDQPLRAGQTQHFAATG
jgi:hypothetical protein